MISELFARQLRHIWRYNGCFADHEIDGVLKFHSAIFRFLGVFEPQDSEQRVIALGNRERELGIRIPEALFEWCSLEDDGHPIYEFELFSPREWELAEGYLRFARDANHDWFVRIDEGDNPAVFETSPSDEFLVEELECWCESLAGFAFDLMAWRGSRQLRYRLSTSWAALPDEAFVEELRQSYDEGPQDNSSERRTWRFFDRETYVRIQSHSRAHQSPCAGWDVEADSERALRDVWQRLENVPGLQQLLLPNLSDRKAADIHEALFGSIPSRPPKPKTWWQKLKPWLRYLRLP